MPGGLCDPSKMHSGCVLMTSRRPGAAVGGQGTSNHLGVQFPTVEQLDRGHGDRGVGPLVAAENLQPQIHVATIEAEDIEGVATRIGEDDEIIAEEVAFRLPGRAELLEFDLELGVEHPGDYPAMRRYHRRLLLEDGR